MERLIPFPSANEYPEYTEIYMAHLRTDGTLIKQLKENYLKVHGLYTELNDEQLNFRYAENKWTVKEVLVHLIDDERIYAYRAMAFARNEKIPLPGFDENQYTKYSDTDFRSLENILKEYKSVRKSTIALFEGFSERALSRMGMADGKQNSVRSLGYHIAGHEMHHFEILKERYQLP